MLFLFLQRAKTDIFVRLPMLAIQRKNIVYFMNYYFLIKTYKYRPSYFIKIYEDVLVNLQHTYYCSTLNLIQMHKIQNQELWSNNLTCSMVEASMN